MPCIYGGCRQLTAMAHVHVLCGMLQDPDGPLLRSALKEFVWYSYTAHLLNLLSFSSSLKDSNPWGSNSSSGHYFALAAAFKATRRL